MHYLQLVLEIVGISGALPAGKQVAMQQLALALPACCTFKVHACKLHVLPLSCAEGAACHVQHGTLHVPGRAYAS